MNTQETLDYLATLTPEQMIEAVNAMPQEVRTALAMAMFAKLTEFSQKIIKNADKIWDEKKLPDPAFFNKTPKANQ